MAYVDPRKKAVTPTPYPGVVPRPIAGPPAPPTLTASQPLSTLTYKQFLDNRMSTKPLAIQFAKLTKNQALLSRLTGTPPQPGASPTPAATPPVTPTDGTAPIAAAPAPQGSDPQLSTVPAPPNVSQFVSTQSLPLPTQVPTVNLNNLYAPAERVLASQRAAALAAQNKAYQDNQAFEQFMQNSLNQGNQALAGTMGQLSQGAATSRQQSVDNITNAIGQMNLSAGGSGDLARLAGSTAASESNPLLQAGQSALNTVPDIAGQAALTYAQGQGAVAGATGRVLNDEATRSTQQALSSTADQQAQLESSKAQAGISQAASMRDYMVQVAQLNALQSFNAGKLSEQGYASATNLMGRLSMAKSRVDVENIRAQVAKMQTQGKLDAATATNLNKLAVERMKQVGATNRTLLTAAAKKSVANTTYGAKAVGMINNLLSSQTQTIDSQNRYQRGQTVKQAATNLMNSFVKNQPNPMPYSQAYSLLSGIPKAGPEALKDPAFVAWLKTQFPAG